VSSSQKTCIVGESRDGTILRPDASKGGWVICFTSGRSNLCFRNFTLNGDRQGTSGSKAGIAQGGTTTHHNWEITDLKIINFGQNLINPKSDGAGNGIVLDNKGTGHYLARLHLEKNGTWGLAHGNGIYWRASNSVIEHSYIKRSAHEGLHLTSSASDAAMDNNIIRYNYIDEVEDGAGIGIHTGNNNLVHDNVVINADYGINVRRTGNQLNNNTVYGASLSCIRLQQGAHIARKNILLNCGRTSILDQSSGSTLLNNVTTGNARDIFINPDAGDFRLKADSPVTGVGATISTATSTTSSTGSSAPSTPGNLHAVAQ
jgi:hypothetical protein